MTHRNSFRRRRSRFAVPRSAFRAPRSGITLVEMLMVVAILVLLVAATLPVALPALQNRRLREASRQVNVFIASAQARAAEKGRPVGVWLERRSLEGGGRENAVTDLFMAEVQPPYSGDVLGALCEVVAVAGNELLLRFERQSSAGFRVLVQRSDLIKLAHRGAQLRVTEIGSFGVEVRAGLPTPPADKFDVIVNLAGYPSLPIGSRVTYQVFRRPEKSIAAPLSLPRGTAIDLAHSGMGADGQHFRSTSSLNRSPVVIMFQPTGAIEQIYMLGGNPFPPVGKVHLLIGRTEQFVQAETPPGAPAPIADIYDPSMNMLHENLTDEGTIWVSISPRNGNITSAENGWNLNIPAPITMSRLLQFAREFSSSGQTMGAK